MNANNPPAGLRGSLRSAVRYLPVGIRTTCLRDGGGNSQVISNSDMRNLTNLSKRGRSRRVFFHAKDPRHPEALLRMPGVFGSLDSARSFTAAGKSPPGR